MTPALLVVLAAIGLCLTCRAMADVFGSDQFGLVSLTTAINKLPYKPSRLGEMGLFTEQGVPTNTVLIEENNGHLALLPSKPRGSAATQAQHDKRTARSLVIPHIPYEDAVLASDVQGVRAFGTEDQMESVTNVVNDRMQKMRQNHELTHEWLRLGAVKGIVVDGDATTTLYNLWTEFGITPPSDVDFDLGTETEHVQETLIGVKETIEAALGNLTYDHIHCLCSSAWFKKFIRNPEVRYAYQYYQEGAMLRSDPRAGFEYAGVTFEVYRGSVGGTPFVPTTDARFFPVGVPDLFQTFFGPADFVETVNTIGLPVYAKQERMAFDRGTTIHTQSNPLMICTRPGVLVKGISNT